MARKKKVTISLEMLGGIAYAVVSGAFIIWAGATTLSMCDNYKEQEALINKMAREREAYIIHEAPPQRNAAVPPKEYNTFTSSDDEEECHCRETKEEAELRIAEEAREERIVRAMREKAARERRYQNYIAGMLWTSRKY